MRFFGLNLRRRARLALERRKVRTVAGIKFYCPNDITRWRAETLLTKEPETIAWINSFAPNSLLWDIGANVGVYSLYAAAAGHRVVAFEPSAMNYYVLNRNIVLNDFDKRLRALCVVLSNVSTARSMMQMLNAELGSASHVLGRGHSGSPPAWEQGALTTTIDTLWRDFGLIAPDYIKIDVDGTELDVVRGGGATLQRVKSVLIEAHTDKIRAEIDTALSRIGFCLDKSASRHLKGLTIHSLIYRGKK